MRKSAKQPKILISVIIPVLNNKQQLIGCLNHLLSDKRYPLEIIIIDGGSCDGTLSVIENYASDISYWESGKDSGISDAFNRGISRATGNIIAILNSDDYWESDTVKSITDAYRLYPDCDIFYGNLRFLNDELHESYIKKPDLKKMKYRMNVFHPAMFVKREAYTKVGLYRLDYKHAMDSEWCHRALKVGLHFHYIPQVLTTMRLGGVSDREFKQSLLEYRKSVVQNELARPLEATIYYYFFLLMKSLMRISWLRWLKFRIPAT